MRQFRRLFLCMNFMKIDSLTKNKLWLAPLAGLTDLPFRTICKENGADVMVSEMVSADGLIYNFQKSIEYAEFTENLRPFGIQLFGSDADIFAKATELIIPLRPDFIDINMGCPVKKVVKRGAGSALMKTPDIAFEIVKRVKSVLKSTGIFLSVKIRAGWDLNSVNAVDFSLGLEDSGADIIIIHPRTRAQMFTGHSDWNIIKQIKEKVSIPVVGNGDINTFEDAKNMYDTTNCDSIMIGRGALGKPWIFNKIKQEKNFTISNEKKLVILSRHIYLAIEKEKNEKRAIIKMRTHLGHYTKGYKNSSKARQKINKAETKEEIMKIFGELWTN